MISPVFEPGLLVGLFAAPGISALLVSQHLRPWETPLRKSLAMAALWTIAGALAFEITGEKSAIIVSILGLILSAIASRLLYNYYTAAHILVAALSIGIVFGISWNIVFIQSLNISSLTRNLLFVNFTLASIGIPWGLITLLPAQAYILRKRWHRPRHSLNPTPRDRYPKVSFHVPCYAEPPDVVCATLDALNQMRYPNFEVLLIDNNTADRALWHPLKQHCDRLNTPHSQPRFRFFHLDSLPGAKAGALNFALRHAADDAELIAIIDADYQAQPDFLERLVGFFDDPKIGFVQTPHDYRDWEENLYQRACYWEYMLFFRLQLACLNEWVASFVIGTMCVLRRRALEEAGGWAEWCLTEDSESTVRIHALGYTSIFLTETFGRGSIPETFREYKKQRFRWTVGPVQQLFKHWRLYLPDPWATPSKLSFWQRILEICHSLAWIQPIAFTAFLLLGLATLASILYHRETIPVPMLSWVAAIAVLPAALASMWLIYRLAGCTKLGDMLAATVASLSLTHVRFVGAFAAVLGGRSLKWRRTSKFKVLPDRLKAIESTQTESLLALLLFVLGCSLVPYVSYSPPDLLFLAMLGLFGSAIAYFSAPIMALLAEFEIQRLWGRSICSPHVETKNPIDLDF
ncbi:MAG: glycosyltransferase [Cyanobacteriota bacterium]|nr:glycosyltransferase [Cyanobacteriota bacterium]